VHNKVIYWHVRPVDRCRLAAKVCEEFTGKHSGERIAAKFVSVLESWGISKQMVRTVIRDNAANMVKAFHDAELPNVGCTLHNLQLAIHDCILDQRAVSDALAACRRLVGHFKHSSAASHRLTELQKELECGPMPNVMVALPNIGVAMCSTPQSLARAHCSSANRKAQDLEDAN